MLRLSMVSLLSIMWAPFFGFAEERAPLQLECEVRSQWKGREVRTYVPGSIACLEQPNEGFWYDSAVEAELFANVNAARVAAGLSELLLRPELLPAVRIHSFDMAQEGFIEHQGPAGRRSSQRVASLDRTLIPGELRENVAGIGGQLDYTGTASLLHRLLIDSDSHRENILADGPTHMAIGVVRAEQGAWVTQVFVQQFGEFSEPVPLYVDPSTSYAFPLPLIPGWEVTSLALLDGDNVHHTLPTNALRPGGDVRLVITGTRNLDKTRRQSIQLNGPLVSVVREPRP